MLVLLLLWIIFPIVRLWGLLEKSPYSVLFAEYCLPPQPRPPFVYYYVWECVYDESLDHLVLR